jgi:hypothetical protein
MNGIKPISAYINLCVAEIAEWYQPKSIIDMGGIGKMKEFVSCPVIDLNITKGQDCTKKTELDDNACDVALSVAVLEHVGDSDKQFDFIQESVRLSKKAVVHWFPFGSAAEIVEDIKRRAGHSHKCIVPNNELLDKLFREFKSHDVIFKNFVTCREHILMLVATFPKLSSKYLYRAMKRFKINDPYGAIMVIEA